MSTLAFLGPEGTFAHAAVRSLAGDDTRLLPCATVLSAIDALRSGSAEAALVPLENSVEGAVPATLDELARGAPLVIVAETYVPVSFDLFVRPGSMLAGLRTIATHPHAEAQVRGWLHANAAQAEVVLVGSTAAGAASVAAGEHDAAISAPVAGELYGLQALARDIADHPGGVTRFVLLQLPQPPSAPTGNDRTTLVAYLRDDHAGALLELLGEFASRSINLTRIESRPAKGRIGQYCFSIDTEGHLLDARVGDALAALHRVCADLRYLGSYPRRDGRQGAVPVDRSDQAFGDAGAWLERVRVTGQS